MLSFLRMRKESSYLLTNLITPYTTGNLALNMDAQQYIPYPLLMFSLWLMISKVLPIHYLYDDLSLNIEPGC